MKKLTVLFICAFMLAAPPRCGYAATPKDGAEGKPGGNVPVGGVLDIASLSGAD